MMIVDHDILAGSSNVGHQCSVISLDQSNAVTSGSVVRGRAETGDQVLSVQYLAQHLTPVILTHTAQEHTALTI